MEVNHSQLIKILRIAYYSKRAYFIWGATGIGKSYSVREFAKMMASELNRKFVEWNSLTREEKLKIIQELDKYFIFIDQRALQFDLGDFKLPKFNEINGTFEWCIPLVYQVICDKRACGVLFFDEFNLAPPSIQGMFYQIINDREIGEHKISDGIMIVGAGNRLEDRANIYEMPSPLLDRFEHLELAIPTLDEWTDWALKNNIDSRIIAFLHFKPSYLFKFEPNSKDKAFPTPRGWHYLSEQLKHVKGNDYKLLEALVSANLGDAACIEMIAFLKLSEKIKIEDVLENPKLVKELDRADLKYSLVSELAEIYRSNEKRLDSIMKVVELLEPEFAILCLRLLKSVNQKHFAKNIINYSFISKYADYLL
jgi:MoxR-like ATPase